MDVTLPLDKLASQLISNEPSPGNTSKYVPFLFVYLSFILCNTVSEFFVELIMNYEILSLQWQDICHSGGNWKLQSTHFHAFAHVW